MNNFDIASQLHIAAAAVMDLELQNRQVQAFHFDGIVPVLLIDKAPTGSEIYAASVREPDGKGGFLRRAAASFKGVRVEWQSHEAAGEEVARG